MLIKTAILSLFLLFIPSLSAWAAPVRVVSLNLCTDQWLLKLGMPEQIAGVSFNAGNASLSPVSDIASGYPLFHADTEQLLPAHPDLVLVGAYEHSNLQHVLQVQGINLYRMKEPDSIAALKVEISHLAEVLGQPGNGATAIRQIERALAEKRTHPFRIAMYYTNGYTENPHGLLADIIARLGMTLLQPPQGKGAFTLEEIIDLQPDFLLLPHYGFATQGQADAILTHPALQHIRKIALDGASLTCPGASVLSLVRMLPDA